MDIGFDNQNNNFKYRVCGIIIKNNKVLTTSINGTKFVSCPGGHVHFGETSKDAVIREIKEEVCIDITNPQLLTVIENIYESDKTLYHELGFYYVINNPEIPEEHCIDYEFLEHDEDKLVHQSFKWIPIDKIQDYDIRPRILKDILSKGTTTLTHCMLDQRK